MFIVRKTMKQKKREIETQVEEKEENEIGSPIEEKDETEND